MPNPERITSYTSKSPRVTELLNFVSQEIERCKSGEISTLSTREELRRRFGFIHQSHVGAYLRKTGLEAERRKLLPIESELIVPSTEWGWMMGVIAGGGYVKLGRNSSSFQFATSDIELREAIRSHGEKLFNTNPTLTTFPNPKRSLLLTFINTKLAKEVGNFARALWVERIQTKHRWILENEKYIWSLLEGIFETRGLFLKRHEKQKGSIYINTALRAEANFIAELLVRVGVQNPKIIQSKNTREGIQRIGISDLEDVKMFAENVHSVIPNKEKSLAFYRESSLKDLDLRHLNLTQDEAIEEWLRATAILGHSPTWRDIGQLKKLKLTRYSWEVYVRLFGKQKGKGRFKAAREEIDKIAKERKNSVIINEDDIREARLAYEEIRLKERRRRMPKSFSNEDILQEWIKARSILGYVPNANDILKLHQIGLIEVSYQTFTSHFGNGKSFASAHDELERLAQEKGEKDSPLKPLYKKPSNNDEAVSEWIRIKDEIAHTPSVLELTRLLEEGKTLFSPYLYIYRFGQGRFSKASENLEKLAFSKEVNESLKQYGNMSGKQIRFVPKIHRPPEEAKRRLYQITGYTEQVSVPQVLYGHDGESIIYPPAKIEDITRNQRYTVDPVTKLIVLKEPEKEKPTSQEIQIFP